MLLYAMLYVAAVGAPIALAAWALAAVLRRYGRAERGVWLAALTLAVAVPLVMLSLADAAGSAPPESTATGVLGLPDLVAVSAEGVAFTVDSYIVALWALLSGVLLARWAIGVHRLRLASREWSTGSIDGVPVQLTTDLGPAVTGVFRPRILVPEWISTLPDAKRTLVLEHERQHILAGDPLLVALARLTRVLLPWNPITWSISSRLIRAVELDCDRRVLEERSDARTYGTTLLDISARGSSRLVGLAAFAESEVPLRSRILAMTTPPRTVSLAAIAASVVLGVVLLVGALEIPVPTLRIQVEIGRAPEVIQQAALPQTFQPSSTRPRLINDEEVRASSEIELERLTRRDLDVRVESRPPDERRPTFTPMSVQPVLLNRSEVARALLQAYPSDLRARGIGGTALLRLRVGAEGRVLDRRVEASSGHASMDEAALGVVDLMRFQPARNRDQRVAVWVSQRATFVPDAPAPEGADQPAR